MKFSEYLHKVNKAIKTNHHLRIGQAAYNVLYEENQPLASQISGTDIDPFYNDRVLSEFYSYVIKNWNKEPDKFGPIFFTAK